MPFFTSRLANSSFCHWVLHHQKMWIDFYLDSYYLFHNWDFEWPNFKPPHLAKGCPDINTNNIFSMIYSKTFNFFWALFLDSGSYQCLNLFGIEFEAFCFIVSQYFWLTSTASLTSTVSSLTAIFKVRFHFPIGIVSSF